MIKKVVSILCLVLALAIPLCGLSFAEDAAQPDGIETIVRDMSLRDKLAQMMFFSVRTWKENAFGEQAQKVRTLNDVTRRFISENHFGGVLLFGENCGDAAQVLRLTADMQAANQEGGGLPMLMALDQEGGTVVRLSFGTSGPGNMAIAATGDPENARIMGRIYGEELALLGINTDFAPVLDVNDNAANPVIGVRSFCDDADAVARYGCAYIEGLRETGTIATAKHFPGHGNTDVDSHTGLPVVDRTRDELMANELVPFKAAIEAGVDMVMTAHIQFPKVESRTYTSISTGEQVYIPATMSWVILSDLLRGELGYEGVIVSDALDMKAITENYAIDDVLVMAINAGVDMLILPGVWNRENLDAIDDMLSRAVALAEAGEIDTARIDDAVARILNLKRAHGLLDSADFSVSDAAVAAAVEGCGSAAHRRTAWDIACKALTLLKNENDAFPMDVKPGEKVLALFTAESRLAAGEFAQGILSGLNVLPEGADIESMAIGPDSAEACVEAAKAADHVLLVSRAWSSASINPATDDGFPVGVLNRVIDDLHAAGRTAVVISCQLPYDAACYPAADAILLAYGSSPMRKQPNAAEEDSAWMPNLPAAFCAAFGAVTPGGRLPVDMPKLDEQYRLTGEVLFSRWESAAA